MLPQQPVDLDPPCTTILFRTIRVKQWFDPDDNTRVKSEAFMRRRPRTAQDGVIDPMDEDGLSVFDSLHMSTQACVEDVGTKSGHGIASLHVGRLRDLGLTVIRDPEDQRKVLIGECPVDRRN